MVAKSGNLLLRGSCCSLLLAVSIGMACVQAVSAQSGRGDPSVQGMNGPGRDAAASPTQSNFSNSSNSANSAAGGTERKPRQEKTTHHRKVHQNTHYGDYVPVDAGPRPAVIFAPGIGLGGGIVIGR